MAYNELSKYLIAAIERLDIPEEIADAAVLEYKRVAGWLCEPGSPLRQHSPSLYSQGSFRLGTPVHPVLPTDDFDIDLVCEVNLSKDQVTQKELKKLIGDRLRASKEFGQILHERRRCWTLDYPGQFHLDVLPTIPDPEHSGAGILLTDKQLVRWQFSNPNGYAEWFYARMRPLFLERQEELAEAAGVTIDDVPEWRIRTPLQRAIQVLKRHRDVRFAARPDERPVSVIVTTLAAQAYSGQRDLATALMELAAKMPKFIECRDGKWWVENPAHAGENFADKWNETPALRDAFLRWLDALRSDVEHLARAASTHDANRLLESHFGIPAQLPPATGRYLAPVAESTSHAKQPPWPGRAQYECTIRGGVYSGRRQGKALRSLDGLPIHKKAWIRFEAVTNAPEPYEVHWQVTNTGSEARAQSQLRGDFYSGEGPGGRYRWETTSYAGTHFVQAFVVSREVVVARSIPFAVRVPSWTPVRLSR